MSPRRCLDIFCNRNGERLIPERAFHKSDTGLPDLLAMVAAALRADGAMVTVGGAADDSVVLASSPDGLRGRRMPLSPALRAICGAGVQPTEKVLLPSSVTGWIGLRPRYVASFKVAANGEDGCLFFWWKEQPPQIAGQEALFQQSVRLVSELAGREAVAISRERLQERLDTILSRVALGIVFVDLLGGSILNPVAAELLGLPEETRETAVVAAAIQRMREECVVETPEVFEDKERSEGAEYWICQQRRLVLRVESHAVGTTQTPGRFWLFTDVKPLWETSERVKVANQVLERNLAQLNEEMERRMEAEAELQKYLSGLRRQNEELEIAKLHSDLLANQDSLTGLANRRRFRHGLDEMIASARRDGSRVAVLYLDLDKFKPVNDTLGHERGDELLRQVAETLTRSLRKDDLVARLGGDEFACALTLDAGMDNAALQELVMQVRGRLDIPVKTDSGKIQVSATVGVALFPDDAEDSVSLLRAADNAMYLGKSRGGNALHLFARG